MSATSFLPKSVSDIKSTPRQQNIASNFSNWNKLLNNVNIIVKDSKKISEKIEVKEKIVNIFSYKDLTLTNINSHIDKKVEKK
jgi:hypothetical protein